jgi:hypothetical protein
MSKQSEGTEKQAPQQSHQYCEGVGAQLDDVIWRVSGAEGDWL